MFAADGPTPLYIPIKNRSGPCKPTRGESQRFHGRAPPLTLRFRLQASPASPSPASRSRLQLPGFFSSSPVLFYYLLLTYIGKSLWVSLASSGASCPFCLSFSSSCSWAPSKVTAAAQVDHLDRSFSKLLYSLLSPKWAQANANDSLSFPVAVLVGPIAAAIIFFGNSAVIVGLWPAHFIWTYYCVLKTERIGLVLKILIGILLPLPLILLPVLAIVGSLLGGIGYGVFVPLMATFEAVGEGVTDKLTHCFMDGTVSAIAGVCTVVRDVTDSCFHSYFSFMDDLIEKMGDDEVPLDIKLSYLPRSMLVALVAVPVDVLMISAVALWKSPCMLLKGWQRLCEDLVGREGPFLETVCVPFAGLAIILWPLAVIGGVTASFFSSFLFGFHAGLIAYQEASFKMGLAYMISAISLFDEYTNDLLYLREGSCLPRPKYRKADIRKCETTGKEGYKVTAESGERQQNGHHKHRRVLRRSKTFMQTIQQLRPIQIWDWFFRSCELNGRILLSEGLITSGDMEEYITKGECKKLSIKLPAWCILQCLIRSAKFDSDGLLISNDVEVTNFNWPKDKVLDWMLGPLLVIKDQMKKLEITEDEEMCLRKLIMTNKNEKPSDWDDSGFPSGDSIKRGQLQAIIRRLQGIALNMSRVPSFRRRFISLVKAMYLEAIEVGAIDGSRDVKCKVKADVDAKKPGDKGSEDVAGSSTDMLADIDMV